MTQKVTLGSAIRQQVIGSGALVPDSMFPHAQRIAQRLSRNILSLNLDPPTGRPLSFTDGAFGECVVSPL